MRLGIVELFQQFEPGSVFWVKVIGLLKFKRFEATKICDNE